MKPGLNITIIETIERGFSRTIVYSDGSRIGQHWSSTLLRWVCIPA